MKTLKTLAAAAGMLALTGAAQAALVSLGDGTVKDTNTNLIWLQNWNVNGTANWSTQKNWADNLTFAGSSDWKLPEINDYIGLFNDYGTLTTVTAFTNVQSFYWSGTELVAGSLSWLSDPVNGGQILGPQDLALYAVAVRPGDVTASVPEPQTLALALLALGATVVARRRRSR